MLSQLKQELSKHANKERATHSLRFFKTGPGEYGEGDKFIGVSVPNQRKVAKQFKGLPLKDIQTLLNSKIHEHRLVALFILIHQYQKTREKKFVNFYLKNSKRINNWDLVDSSAHKIVGDWLIEKGRKVLYKFAKSTDLWERRISIIATFAFIAKNDFSDAIKISEILLHDKHDLIHKAVGWTLREVGKKNEKILLKFLDKHHKTMPRTCLRYAIERLSKKQREYYMKKS